MSNGSKLDGSGEAPEPLGVDDDNIASPEVTLETAAEDLEFWTASAMEEAEPITLDIDEGKLQAAVDAMNDEAARDDDAGPGGSGMTAVAGEPEEMDEEDDVDPTATSGGYNYPGPFTRYEVSKIAPYTKYPYSTVGKLFFQMDGRNYVGSAASIGGHAIFTAGHCVHKGNGKSSGWAKKVVFVPAYKDGSAPFGKWSASSLMCRTLWYNKGIPGGLSQDMGGAILRPLGGKKISQRVGWLGFAWNWGRFQHWHSVGYPAAAPFNGRRMYDVQASFAYRGSVPGTKPLGMGNDMTGGCSGGPWIRKFGSSNQLNGVNSYRRSSKPKELFSPYFNNSARSLQKALVSK